MLTKLIDYVKELFYTPQIGDKYYLHASNDPWDLDTRKKDPYIITDIREGYLKYVPRTNMGRNNEYYSIRSISSFKSIYTRIK